MGERTLDDLRQKQALPLSVKLKLTMSRIRQWINEYDEDGVYVSFSGGKDSSVLLDIVRNKMGYKNVPAVFVDTGLEYPEIREHVKSFDNVVWLKPKMNFRKVIETYGYPFISKEVSEKAFYAQRYIKWYLSEHKEESDKIPSPYGIADMLGVHGRKDGRFELFKAGVIPEEILNDILSADGKAPGTAKALWGTYLHKENGIKTEETSQMFDFSRYRYLASCPYSISSHCCRIMKKGPVHKYAKDTGRKPMTAQMAQESRLRTNQWLHNGCNGFNLKSPISNPMAFWTEQDVLLYIKENNLPICSVYGDIIEDISGTEQVENQLTFSDLSGFENNKSFDAPSLPLKTTGCSRTGCMFCGYGCHLDKPGEGRFERMKETHPKQYEWIMKPWDEGGLGYKDVIDWLNEHGNLNIRY